MIGERQVIIDFRRILKHMKQLPSFKAKTSPMRLAVLDQYKSGRKETNEENIKEMRNRAYMYAEMVTDVKTLKQLRGLDSGERLDPRDKIRATAARVGLAVPFFADEFKVDSNSKETAKSESK